MKWWAFHDSCKNYKVRVFTGTSDSDWPLWLEKAYLGGMVHQLSGDNCCVSFEFSLLLSELWVTYHGYSESNLSVKIIYLCINLLNVNREHLRKL